MTNPIEKICTVDTWTKVASSVTTGLLKRLNKRPTKYLETYRIAGGNAPTDGREGAEMFINSESEIIISSSAIDVYVMAIGEDGKVRVDL